MTKHREFDDFDQFADNYEDIHNANIRFSGAKSDELNRERVEIVSRHEKLLDPKVILDFGCGPGRTQEYLHTYFPNATLIGIDPSKDSIVAAKRLKVPNSTFLSFDGKNWPVDDDSLDVVIMANVLHHISFDQHVSIMHQARKKLKKGGRLYIFEHNPLNPLTLQVVKACPFDDDAILLKYPYTKRLLVETGFTKTEIRFYIFLPRFAIFKPFILLERFFSKLIIGGKYYVRTVSE